MYHQMGMTLVGISASFGFGQKDNSIIQAEEVKHKDYTPP